ncbi:MFS transporter [Corynebacterium macginleyi]|uniref:MFS transporter n=1 Tax=Corynebacterium macginleyi TaxID=38290 RepID=UPI002D7E26C4|nr:MFS transporter [Corynebacterium macginleyi]
MPPLSTVSAVFRGKYRLAALGVWFAVISGAAVGPLAAGALTEWVSWHWIFPVNVPVCIIVAIGAVLTVRETCSPDKLPGVYLDGVRCGFLVPVFRRLGTAVFRVVGIGAGRRSGPGCLL